MFVITSLQFQGTSITPTYANVSVVGGALRMENLVAMQIDDIVNNDLSRYINSGTTSTAQSAVVASNTNSGPNTLTNVVGTYQVNAYLEPVAGLGTGVSATLTFNYQDETGNPQTQGISVSFGIPGPLAPAQIIFLARVAAGQSLTYTFTAGGGVGTNASYFISVLKLS